MSAETPARIGVLGGAFDPPHLAHFQLAQAAIEQYALQSLLILPMGQAWYKARSLSAAQHRLQMAELHFQELPQAHVDARETLRSGPSYTFDTLQELRQEHPDAQLLLILGADQLAFFPHWHRYEEILKIATLLVAFRADSMPHTGQKDLEKQGKIPHSQIQMPASPISSTQIRQLCLQGESIDHLVKPAVARYIAKHRLYRST